MAVLFEMQIRLGSDPRKFGEFTALCDELAKLNHPACPDVDWAKVEALCLALFQKNGTDLQSVAFFTLARGQRYGLEGMVQGVALIESLGADWRRMWPSRAAECLDILNWLFAHLQSLLRGLEVTRWQLTALVHLGQGLERLNEQLNHQAYSPLVTLLALRQQVSCLMQRLQQDGVTSAALQVRSRLSEPALVAPLVLLPAIPVPDFSARDRKRVRRRNILGLLVALVCLAVLGGYGSRYWLANQERERVMNTPVRLDSLSLFDAGSAELRPGSTKVLVNALVGIKAQPGWLIVIAGHTDASGNAEQNMKLSHARASAVRDWMQRMGDIADSCFAVRGLAASQPIASNDTEPGRVANRRVDIQLVPQAGACGETGVRVDNG